MPPLWVCGVCPLGSAVVPALPSSGGVAESPCRRTVKVLGEVFAAVLEFVPDKADPVEVGSHGEFLVFDLRLFGACAPLSQCLMVEGKGEDNVASDFACVKGAVEPSQLNRAVSVEKAVKVEEMVAAVVVMGISRSVVAVVPDVLNGLKIQFLDSVQFLDQFTVHLLAESCPFGVDLQGFVKEVVLACDDVDEVLDALRCVVRSVKVDVNAAGGVGKSACLAEFSDQPLQSFDVLAVGEDGADHLDAVVSVRSDLVSVFLALGVDASVAHELPLASVGLSDFVGAVVSADVLASAVQVSGGGLCGGFSGDSGELDLDSKSCGKHCVYLSILYLFPLRYTHITSKSVE